MEAASRSSLEHFELISRLGSGSFGVVYKARRTVDNCIYVIKSVRISELSYKEQTVAINEVELLSQMASEYVVRYFDSFIDGESLFIVMEYCNRGDLQKLLKKAKSKDMVCLREEVTWNIILQVILGLHYLHGKNILHRDLKAANVFLTKDASHPYFLVKIGDLGVAKLLETSTAFAQTIVGTPYYLSPELCADEPYRDKSDCWALGVLIYECCTLRHPFEARNQCALIMKIIQAEFDPLPTSHVSDPLANLIYWLLQKAAQTRPSTADILCDSYIRSKLVENSFALPEIIQHMPITTYLSPPQFEEIFLPEEEPVLPLPRHEDKESEFVMVAVGPGSDSGSGGTGGSVSGLAEENASADSHSAASIDDAAKLIQGMGDGDASANLHLRRIHSSGAGVINAIAGGYRAAPRKPSTAQGRNPLHRAPMLTSVSVGAGAEGAYVIRGDRVRRGVTKRVMSEKARSRHQVRSQELLASSDAKRSSGISRASFRPPSSPSKQQSGDKEDLQAEEIIRAFALSHDPNVVAVQYTVRDASAAFSASIFDGSDEYKAESKESSQPSSYCRTGTWNGQGTPPISAGAAEISARVAVSSHWPPSPSQEISLPLSSSSRESSRSDRAFDVNGRTFHDSESKSPSSGLDYALDVSKGLPAMPDESTDADATIVVRSARAYSDRSSTSDRIAISSDATAAVTVSRLYSQQLLQRPSRSSSDAAVPEVGLHVENDKFLDDCEYEEIFEEYSYSDGGDNEFGYDEEFMDDGADIGNDYADSNNFGDSMVNIRSLNASYYNLHCTGVDHVRPDSKDSPVDGEPHKPTGYDQHTADEANDVEKTIQDLQDLIGEARKKALCLMGEDLFLQVYGICSRHMTAVSTTDEAEGAISTLTSTDDSALMQELEASLFEKMRESSIEIVCSMVFKVKVLLALENKVDILNEKCGKLRK